MPHDKIVARIFKIVEAFEAGAGKDRVQAMAESLADTVIGTLPKNLGKAQRIERLVDVHDTYVLTQLWPSDALRKTVEMAFDEGRKSALSR
jgi:hypothetical protein